jgi:hypothetical protein
MSELHGVQYERYLEKQRHLEYLVLTYLLHHPDEAVTLDHLSARYRGGSFLIALVLNQLRRWNYITVDRQLHVTITGAGADRLTRLHRWGKNADHDQ